MMEIGKVLTIAGSDSCGGAGIQADLKTITALGGFGMSVVTALTAQNTLGVQGIHEIPVEFVKLQFNSVAGDIGIDAAKTGMLASSEIIAAVAEMIRIWEVTRLVVDPVMVAKGGAQLIRDDAKETLVRELLPLACVVTPNAPEAEELTGMSICSLDDMKKAAVRINAMGPRHVYIKGGHMGGDALDVLFDGIDFYELSTPRIATMDTHGTGCTLSSAIAAGLAQKMTVLEAAKRAKDYITWAIRCALRIGAGHGPVNHLAPVFRERSHGPFVRGLKRAVEQMEETPSNM
jgi:hydroxymethylpyrimidine/phosphomethylpyrimidine kinase